MLRAMARPGWRCGCTPAGTGAIATGSDTDCCGADGTEVHAVNPASVSNRAVSNGVRRYCMIEPIACSLARLIHNPSMAAARPDRTGPPIGERCLVSGSFCAAGHKMSLQHPHLLAWARWETYLTPVKFMATRSPQENSKETLNKSSPRRMPGSSLLISLDSGMRRNDESGLVQSLPNYECNQKRGFTQPCRSEDFCGLSRCSKSGHSHLAIALRLSTSVQLK